MHKKSFIQWYIGEGFREFFAIWQRSIAFIPRYFSIALLLRTIFAPWHKDISPKNWRGFSPIKSTQKLLWNFFARIIGAIVRSCVIIFALFTWVFVIVGGAIAILMYLAAPAFWIISFVFFFGSFWMIAVSTFVVTTSVVLLVHRIYRISGHRPYRQMDIAELHQQKWFYRVYERMGVSESDIPESIHSDFESFKKFLTKQDITIEEFEKIATWEIEKQKEREDDARFFSAKKFLKKQPIGLNWHFGYTVQLDKYAQDLTRFDASDYAHAPFYGFEQEMGLLEVVLARPSENSAILTGEPGIGRHLIVHELARRIRSGHFEHNFMKHLRVLQCDFTSIMAQARSVGDDVENVIHELFHETAYAGNVILVVDNLEQYMNTNNNQGFSFSTIIDEYASLESFRMIGIVTDGDFHDQIENNRVLMRHFDVIPLHEMSEENTMKVLFTRFYGKEHTPFTYQALRQIIVNANRYTNTAPLPTRAIDLAMEVFVVWQNSGTQFITRQTVDDFVREKTGVPVGDMQEGESEQLLSLEDTFHESIVGQDYAVQNIASAVRRMRSGMARPDKPAGSFLFLGPTGVGKTEMAKVLAQQYYGSKDKVIRLDMSEFQGDNAIDRLLGSKELNQQGILTTAAREHPYGLLLLDEIEKANPRVLDIFLQILDEGFLHDAFGRKASFTTMIIIATSNAAAIMIKKMIENGIESDAMKKKIVDIIIDSGEFRPELLNRFDDVVIFHPLGDAHIPQVTQMLLAKFAKRVDRDQHISVVFEDGVAEEIIVKGFDPVFGARSLIHYIDDAISDALAKKLIAGNIHRGETVYFTVSDMES